MNTVNKRVAQALAGVVGLASVATAGVAMAANGNRSGSSPSMGKTVVSTNDRRGHDHSGELQPGDVPRHQMEPGDDHGQNHETGDDNGQQGEGEHEPGDDQGGHHVGEQQGEHGGNSGPGGDRGQHGGNSGHGGNS